MSNALTHSKKLLQQLIQSRWFPILLVLLVGLGVRVALLAILPDIPTLLDQGSYRKLAVRLVNEGLLNWDYDLRAPGYIFVFGGEF